MGAGKTGVYASMLHTFCARARALPSRGGPFAWKRSAEEELSEVGQVTAPDHPGVHARSFDVGMRDGFGGEPFAQVAVDVDEMVFGAAGDPEQFDLLAGVGVECGEFLVEFRTEAAGAKGANPGELVERVEAGEERFCAAHGETGDGARVAILLYKVFGFDARNDFGEQGFSEFTEVAVGDGAIAEGAGVGLEDFGIAVAERHDDEHGLGFALRDEVVEDDVGAADGGPGGSVITVAVKKVEDGIGLLACRVVAGRCVHVVVAMIADDGGLVEMMMNFAMRDSVCFPGERSGTGNMNFAGAVEEVGFDGVVGRVEVVDAVHNEAVAVEIGSERIRGEAPRALIIFLHRRWLGGAFDGDGDFLGIGSTKAEADAIVGVDFGRGGGRRLRLSVGMARRNQFGEKQSCEQQREAFHQVHLKHEIRDNSGGGMLQHDFAALHAEAFNLSIRLVEVLINAEVRDPFSILRILP